MNNKKQKTSEAKGGLFEITVKAAIIKDGKEVLLFRRAKDMEYFPEHYDLPGGSVEKGETLVEALLREIQEETGIEAEIGPIVYAFDFQKDGLDKNENGHGKGIRFIAFYKSGEVELNDENGSFEWVKIDEAIEKLSDEGYERDKKTTLIKAKEYLEIFGSLDGWKRCQADFENYKKRQVENQKDLIKYACQNMALEIIPVLDNFHVSTDHIPEDQKDNQWVIGIMHIQKQMEKVLADAGVSEIEVKIGDKFNPELHEAIETDAKLRNKSESTNKITKVIQRGYKMGERVIRPARVIVN